MNNTQTTCPACGSNSVTRSEKESSSQLTLGSTFSYQEINYKCTTCHEEGDFLAETDKNYLIAQKEAQSGLVKQLQKEMSAAGISMAMFERVFELPPRTLTRWKNGDFSSSALALLRIAATYPWIIEVAENKFNKAYSKSAVISAAAQELKKEINIRSNTNTEISKTNNQSPAGFVVGTHHLPTTSKSIKSSAGRK